MKHSLSIIAAAACLLANSAWSQEHAIHSGALDFPALGAVEGQSDISALIDRRWRAEATYRTSLAEYLAAYKEMAASYEKVAIPMSGILYLLGFKTTTDVLDRGLPLALLCSVLAGMTVILLISTLITLAVRSRRLGL